MSKRLVLMTLVLLLGLAGSVSAAVIDDFESYSPAALPTDADSIYSYDTGAWRLQMSWPYGSSFGFDLAASGGTGDSKALIATGNAGEGGIIKKTYAGVGAQDWSGGTLRIWQRATVSGGMSVDELVWRISIKAGGNYYESVLSNATTGIGGDGTAFPVNGAWGGGLDGGYIDFPLAGYGDGTGADDWVWKQVTGTPSGGLLLPDDTGYIPPDLTSIERLQFVIHSWATSGSYSILLDDIKIIPEPSSLLLGSFGLAFCGVLRRRRQLA